jgi:hypothetical protein
MPKWKAWSLITFFVALTGAMLWMGMVIVVRCERLHEEQVDVTLERRFLGLITVSKEVVPDVTRASVAVVWNRGSTNGKVRRGSIYKLEITPRDGPTRLEPGSALLRLTDQRRRADRAPSRNPPVSRSIWWMPSVVTRRRAIRPHFQISIREPLLRARFPSPGGSSLQARALADDGRSNSL